MTDVTLPYRGPRFRAVGLIDGQQVCAEADAERVTLDERIHERIAKSLAHGSARRDRTSLAVLVVRSFDELITVTIGRTAH